MSVPSYSIGIAGGTGAGKTTVARDIAKIVGSDVTRIPLDNYYEDLSHLEYEERKSVNHDHPQAFEWKFLRNHLETLSDGDPIGIP